MSDEDDGGDPKPTFGRAVWLWILFGFFCVLAGLAVATLGPRLFPPA